MTPVECDYVLEGLRLLCADANVQAGFNMDELVSLSKSWLPHYSKEDVKELFIYTLMTPQVRIGDRFEILTEFFLRNFTNLRNFIRLKKITLTQR